MADKETTRLMNNLDFLLQDSRPQEVAASNIPNAPKITSRTALAPHVGVKSHSNLSGRNSFSDPINAHLQRIYGMPAGSELWKAFKTGERKQLEILYYETHSASPPAQPDTPNLASLELFFYQALEGDPVPVAFELICQPEPMEGLESIAIKQGILVLDSGKLMPPKLKERAGYKDDIVSERNDVKRTISIHHDKSHPAWRINALSDDLNAPIGVLLSDANFKFELEYNDREQPREITEALCAFHGMRDGDVISARFIVYVKDLVEACQSSPNQKSSYSFIDAVGGDLSQEARAIIRRATALMTVDKRGDGWAITAQTKKSYNSGNTDYGH